MNKRYILLLAALVLGILLGCTGDWTDMDRSWADSPSDDIVEQQTNKQIVENRPEENRVYISTPDLD